MRLLIKGGTIIDPGTGYDGPGDLLIENGKVVEILPDERVGREGEGRGGEGREKGLDDTEVYDARGLVVTPGLIDIHTHLREPGYEYKETIATGTRAAAAGGVTSLACMANTEPVNDNGSVTEYILNKAKATGVGRVYPIGAVTRGLKGESLSEIGDMKEAGVVALSDDGNVVMDSSLMRRGLEYARTFGLPVITHSEDMSLVGDGVMSEGFVSTELGLPAAHPISEAIMVFRDVMLAKITGARLHVAHVSTKEGVKIIREAKGEGVDVTAETCPHYFTLTSDEVKGFDTNTKVNPPLREPEDCEAVIEGLKEGVIDVIASDHAPHNRIDKEVEYIYASSGISGIETLLALSLKLVHDKKMGMMELIRRLTSKPARVMGISGGTLAKGARGDVVIFDPDEEWVVKPEAFFSKGENTPFSGWKLKGRVKSTFVDGKLIFKEGEIV